MTHKGIILRVALGVLAIMVAGTFLFKSNLERSNELYKKQVEHDFQTKYTLLEDQLKASERERLVLIDSFNNRNLYIKTLLELNKGYEKELKDVKGRYNKLTSSEKAIELTRRANGN